MNTKPTSSGEHSAFDGQRMPRRAGDNMRARTWKTPVVTIIALGALLGILAALLHYTYSSTPQAAFLAAATGSKVPPNSAVVAVVFKDRASLKNLRLLLESVQAKMIDGPNATGVWHVAVPKDNLKDAMKVLSESTMVDSAVLQ